MSENEKGAAAAAEGSTSKEPDWDMLSSLSSSAYTDKGTVTDSLYMSDFVFPPNEHENLPIEPDVDPDVEPVVEVEVELEMEVELAEEQIGGSVREYLSSPEGVRFFEEGRRVALHDSEEDETGNSLGDDDKSTKNDGDDAAKAARLPCEAWWKRHAICLYKNVKEANTIWSVLVATALMGLVILGQRWHKEKFQINRWRFYISNEMASKILGSRR